MKQAIFAIALAVAGIGSAAAHEFDEKFNSEDNTMSVVVHASGANYGINDNKELQVDLFVTAIIDGKLERELLAVTGCDATVGGRITRLSTSTGKAVGKPYIWMHDGLSMNDGIAQSACRIAYRLFKRDQAKKAGYSM